MSATDLTLLPPTGGSKPDAALGLALARRIERTYALLRQARRRVKRSEAKGKKRARKQLDRLQEVLGAVEQDALALGVRPAFAEDASRILSDADEHLDAALARKQLKKRHMRRLRRSLKDVRRRMEALMTSIGTQSTPVAPDLAPEPRAATPSSAQSRQPPENHPS